MKSIYKRLIFFFLFTIFLIYSFVIYKSEPHNGVGQLSIEAQEGKLVFQKYNCISCHQLYGLGGYMGPDLTNVINVRGENYAKAFIMNGTEKMPKFSLSSVEIDQIIRYLTEVGKSGNSPVLNFTVNSDGSITNSDEK